MSDLKLIANNSNIKVITTLQKQLNNCKEFAISVAFITESGVAPLLQTLKQLEKQDIKGRIITSDYLFFSQPKALRKLNKFSNISIRLYSVDSKDYGFHTKGYIFKNFDDKYSILIGSSNLTHKALTVNKEWNLLCQEDMGDVTCEILDEFNTYWDEAIDIEDCIDAYEEIYEKNLEIQKNSWIKPRPADFKPNKVQREFIRRFNDIYSMGERRGLFISATGTGKTLASAFAIRDVKPQKVLFLVHREQIAKQAMMSYMRVFKDKSMGLISGTNHDYYCDFIFSTVQMMSKPDIYMKYAPDEFDIIVIDEVHHAGASSYQKIMDYFTPRFYLGMTATPERSDEFDIYTLFDHNIIYEIRLKDAMEEELLCNFNYYGVTDNALDVNDTSDERVEYIIENIEFYGYSGSRLKGLVFCNSVSNARALSEKFNEHGYKTTYLSGSNSQSEREEQIKRLISDDVNGDILDYIFTVDIFNEGVDISEINQIVMLRETKSSIIFTQQLGRGLRKCDGKEFVVIVDFIGNYRSNFMIPIALSGDVTYNKDKLRRFMFDHNNMIVGSSTVNFDSVAKERIYSSIDKVKFNINFFRNEYVNLKDKLGCIPMLSDFDYYNQLDPALIVGYIKKNVEGKCYPCLVERRDCDYHMDFNSCELLYLEFLTLNVFNAKRVHEVLILKEIIEKGMVNVDELIKFIDKNYGFNDNETTIHHAIRKLDKSYFKPPEFKYFSDMNLIKKDAFGFICIHPQFKMMLDENPRFRNEIEDLLELSLKYYEDNFTNTYLDCVNFQLYKKYSKWDMACLLNWYERDPVYGYVIKENPLDGKITCPICVTYDHYDHVNEFKDKQTISWVTTTPRTLQSKDIKNIIEKNNEIEFLLFIKKNNDDGRDFYYMGPVKPVNPKQGTLTNTKGDVKPTVYFDLKLKYPVRDDIYEYIISGNK